MHFWHISAKIQPKNLKQHFDRGSDPLGPILATTVVKHFRLLTYNTTEAICEVLFQLL